MATPMGGRASSTRPAGGPSFLAGTREKGDRMYEVTPARQRAVSAPRIWGGRP